MSRNKVLHQKPSNAFHPRYIPDLSLELSPPNHLQILSRDTKKSIALSVRLASHLEGENELEEGILGISTRRFLGLGFLRLRPSSILMIPIPANTIEFFVEVLLHWSYVARFCGTEQEFRNNQASTKTKRCRFYSTATTIPLSARKQQTFLPTKQRGGQGIRHTCMSVVFQTYSDHEESPQTCCN